MVHAILLVLGLLLILGPVLHLFAFLGNGALSVGERLTQKRTKQKAE